MKNISDIELFNLLKIDLTNRFFESNSASSKDISEWKGQDIVSFQEDMFAKTKSTVSEKWFYTYFKSDFKKLPRIDMLNLLAQYAGYSSWSAFYETQQRNYSSEKISENQLGDGSLVTKESQSIEVIEEAQELEIQPLNQKQNDKEESESLIQQKKKEELKKKNLLPIVLFSILAMTVVGVSAYFSFFYHKTYTFCFVDQDRNSNITEPIEITIERKGFTPLELLTVNGCVEFPSTEDTLLMFIKSTYYKQDTFKINLHQYQGTESIRLQPDDYKVMLRHYSKSSQSVKERIKMLDQMIANDALIYQVYDNEYFGVEVLSKKQYINLVSLPTTSLKNFTLIEADRKNGKIVKIKFKIASDEN